MYNVDFLDNKITNEEKQKFFKWINTRRQSTIKTLTVLSFYIDSKINYETCLFIFNECVKNDIFVLRKIVICKNCDSSYNYDDVSEKILCEECGMTLEIDDETIEIFYMLKNSLQN